MEKQLNISEELISISEAVAAIERKNTYSVPDQYFEEFSNTMLLLVSADPQLSISKSDIYEVPVNYFETFADTVLQRIKSEETPQNEIEILSPLLASLKTKTTYTVPEGYFDTVVADAPIEQPEAKVFRMEPQKKSSWSRYAVAASVAVVLGITGFFTFNKSSTSSEDTMAVTGGSVEQKMNVVPDEELEDYIYQTTDYPLISSEGEPQVEAALSDLEESDIKDYLKENSDLTQSPTKGI